MSDQDQEIMCRLRLLIDRVKTEEAARVTRAKETEAEAAEAAEEAAKKAAEAAKKAEEAAEEPVKKKAEAAAAAAGEKAKMAAALAAAMADAARAARAAKVPRTFFEWVSDLRYWGVEPEVLNICEAIQKIFELGRKEQRTDGTDVQRLQRNLLNQKVPFHFVRELFELFEASGSEENMSDDLVVGLVLRFFRDMRCLINPKLPAVDTTRILDTNPAHLLEFVYNSLCFGRVADQMASQVKTTLDVENMEEEEELEMTNYATELQEAGIKFNKSKGSDCLLHVEFEKGVMKMPPLKVSHNTLEYLKYLKEHESRFPDSNSHQRYVSDYVKLLQCLVNSPKDVETLRRGGIIENWLGNDQVIFNELSKITERVKISRRFTYTKLFKDVNEHCRHRRNVWMAKLWNNYFNSPWSLISFIAAVVLLVLTIIQTIFSVLSYYRF